MEIDELEGLGDNLSTKVVYIATVKKAIVATAAAIDFGMIMLLACVSNDKTRVW